MPSFEQKESYHDACPAWLVCIFGKWIYDNEYILPNSVFSIFYYFHVCFMENRQGLFYFSCLFHNKKGYGKGYGFSSNDCQILLKKKKIIFPKWIMIWVFLLLNRKSRTKSLTKYTNQLSPLCILVNWEGWHIMDTMT